MSTGNLGRKIWFLEKNFSCTYRFQKGAKKIRPSGKIFWQGCADCFDLSVGSFWEVFLKKIRYILSFLHTEQNFFGIQSQTFQQGRQKELSKLLIISGHWANSFRAFVKKYCSATKTAFCVFTGTVWTKKLLEKKSWVFLIFFRRLSKKILAPYPFFFRWSCQKCILRVHGNTSMKNVFEKILYDFTSFSDFDWKKNQLSGTHFSAGLKKLHFASL